MGSSERAADLRALYDAFNDRDLDAVLAAMAPDVDWPNGWEGVRVVGRAEVRRYWVRQWEQIRPRTIVTGMADRPDGTVAVKVRLVVRDPSGTVLERSDVTHVYASEGDLVSRMDVEP